MKIKINNKKVELRPSSEMTVSEYRQLYQAIPDGASKYEALLHVIAITTGHSIRNVLEVDIDEKNIDRLIRYVGLPVPLHDIPEQKTFYYGKEGRLLHQHKCEWQTAGFRLLFNNFDTESRIEQMVYMVAILLTPDYDAKKAIRTYENLLGCNYVEVLGFAIFFFRNFSNGKSSGKSFSRWLRRILGISTRIL